MIEFVKGDFFDYKADIRINTVNCVGVMGAGVALEFKTKYPEMFKAYVEVCKRREIAPGNPFLWEEYDLFSRCIIINLPTKLHWRDPSEYDYIERDLIWLRDYLKDKSCETTVTLPALGCGHGGLNWDIVKSKIDHYLSNLQAKVLVFEPASSNKQLAETEYRPRLQESAIETLYPDDKDYPSILRETHKKEIYCKGNIELLNYNKISLVLGNTISEKELSAVNKILGELNKEDLSIAIGLSNKKQLELAQVLLEEDNKLIMIIPYGILQFKYSEILRKFRNKYLLLSFVQPMQEYKKYEYANSFKKSMELADIVLCCCENTEDIRKRVAYIKNCKRLFYVNFGEQSTEAFSRLDAQKLSISAVTNKPNVTMLQQIIKLI